MIFRKIWTIFVLFFTLLMVYYNITFPVVSNTDKVAGIESTTTLKKIVAYSLNKRIELEGKEYFCEEDLGGVDISNIKYSYGIWNQVEDTELYVTSVTLDKRLDPHHYLRIIGVFKGSSNGTTYCQILLNDGNLRIIKSTVTPIWYEKWDMNDNNTYYNPTLLSCRLPRLEKHLNPMGVSLSSDPCAIHSTFLKITRPFEAKQINFTVCVKPLNFRKDISKHLVQWIEICRILGAEHFHIFLDHVTNNTRRILKWYKSRFPNTIHIEDFRPVEIECQNCSTRSFFKNTWQRRRYEIAAYNKCFNKNTNSKYIVPLDIDEIIVPKSVRYWWDLLQDVDNNCSSLIVQNVYFFTRNRTSYKSPFFFSENRRISVPSKKGENGKSFISTKNTLTVFNHYALHLLRPGAIKDYFLPFRDVQLNHYKDSCNYVIFPECAKYLSSPTIIDDVVSSYKNEFNLRYGNVLDKIADDQIKLF